MTILDYFYTFACPIEVYVSSLRRRFQERAVVGGTRAEGRANHAARQKYDGESGSVY